MKAYKAGIAKYNAILEEYPDVKQALAPAAAPAKQVAKPEEQKATAASAASLTFTAIYEKFHDAESTNAMSVIDSEIARCTKVRDSSTDEEVQDVMDERIAQLEMNKESIQGDIEAGILSIEGYVAQLKKYQASETANIKKAKEAGVGKEHLKLIMDRIDTVKGEIAEMDQGMAGQAAEAEAAAAA